MDIKEYRKKTRKTITCPSGLKLKIRKVKALDYLSMGFLPDTLGQMKKEPEKTDPKLVEGIHKMFLTKIVIPNKDFKIVDKPLNELKENEISYTEIEDDDSKFIIDSIVEYSANEKEAKGEPKDFCEESISDSIG